MAETFESLLEKIKDGYKEYFGDELNTRNQSNNMRINYPIISNLLSKFEQMQYYLDNRDIYKAEGLWLDYLLGNYNFLRKQASYAFVTWTTTDSAPNTIVDAGELFVNDGFGHEFRNRQSFQVQSDGSVEIDMISTQRGEEYNVGALLLTNISSPIFGIGTGTNNQAASGGQDRESDFEFRTRFLNSKVGSNFWNINGLYNAIINLDGVISVFVEENDKAIQVGELPPHSIRVTADGGDNEEIARAIFEKSDYAIQRIGNVEVNIQDVEGVTRSIRFQRPSTVTIEYQFFITGTADTQGITEELKKYIDDAPIRSLISEFQAIRYVQERISLDEIDNITINFRRSGDVAWVQSIQLGTTENSTGLLVV